jgi:1,4-dihydroxy-2-naphthoate polyprenyltransferase
MANPWLIAFRPKTLPAAAAPVLIGTAIAYGHGVHYLPMALLALFGALTIQIGTNLANDYFDYVNGADTPERIGPTRVTQSGLIAPADVKAVMILVFALSAAVCAVLVLRAGWPVLIIGVLSIFSGIFYTAGPRPLGYLGLGEVFAFIFFGPVAVAGTYYVQSLEFSWPAVVAGLAPGFFSVAILSVNNLRDMQTDRKAKKLTLAVRFGREFALSEYLFAVIAAALTPVAVYVLTGKQPWALVACGVLFAAIPIIKTVLTKPDGPSLNEALAATGKLLAVYSIIYSIGWIVR